VKALERRKSCGSGLAREENAAVFQELRVIVLRGQATLPQVLRLNWMALWLAGDGVPEIAIAGKLLPCGKNGLAIRSLWTDCSVITVRC